MTSLLHTLVNRLKNFWGPRPRLHRIVCFLPVKVYTQESPSTLLKVSENCEDMKLFGPAMGKWSNEERIEGLP